MLVETREGGTAPASPVVARPAPWPALRSCSRCSVARTRRSQLSYTLALAPIAGLEEKTLARDQSEIFRRGEERRRQIRDQKLTNLGFGEGVLGFGEREWGNVGTRIGDPSAGKGDEWGRTGGSASLTRYSGGGLFENIPLGFSIDVFLVNPPKLIS